MKTCLKCGRILSDDQVACPVCEPTSPPKGAGSPLHPVEALLRKMHLWRVKSSAQSYESPTDSLQIPGVLAGHDSMPGSRGLTENTGRGKTTRAVKRLIQAIRNYEGGGGDAFNTMCDLDAALEAVVKDSDTLAVPVLLEYVDRNLGADPELFPGTVHNVAKMLNSLGQLGDRRAVPLLIRALSNTPWGVAYSAARYLWKFGDPEAIEPLIRLLGHESDTVSGAALEALVRIGAPAVSPLIRALERWEDADEATNSWLSTPSRKYDDVLVRPMDGVL
jgi:hypothetical protein